MIQIFNSDGKQISTSKNLRGIMDRTRKLGAAGMKVHVAHSHLDCIVYFKWIDGSYSVTDFADSSVAIEWVNRPSMKDANINVVKF